jgi:hypothetical protein
MIAIVNNCSLFEELGQELRGRWWKSGLHDNEATAKFEQLLSVFATLKSEASNYLLDESFLDIEIQFAKLMTPEWARPEATEAIDTVATTMDDYFDDYNFLMAKNFELVTTYAQDRVARRYITSLLQPSTNVLRKRVTFERPDQRMAVAKKVAKEAKQLHRFFHKVAGDLADFDSPFKAIEALAEVLGCDDEMLALDIGTLCKKYPDVSHDQLLCLLLLRGDLVSKLITCRCSALLQSSLLHCSCHKFFTN